MDRRRRVVITGLGVVAPNGIGKDTFWANLLAGKSGVDYISAFDPSPFPSKIAAEVRDFVPTDFIATRAAKTMARFSAFGVAATRLALEDARLPVNLYGSANIAISYGNCVGGLGDLADEASVKLHSEGLRGLKPWAALEYPPHATASYLAIEFHIKGPALSLSSNCCTGLDAIHLATSLIRSGRVDAAIAGGCDAPLFPLPFSAFCALGALSQRNQDPARASRPYDLLRDGLVLGEGAATLVLEEFEAAQSRGATIYAEVLGYAAASEALGMRKGDIEGDVMATALTSAIRNSGLTPSDIDHINAHGSSLPDYDVCDTNAFKKALRAHAYRVPISSIKSMIGQPIAAAGALQAVSAALSIAMQRVPPTINQEVSDDRCDLDYVPNKARTARVRSVLLNGHSFGGSVSALVLARPDQA